MIPVFQLTKKIAAEARLKVVLAGIAVFMFGGVSVAQPKISLSPAGGPPTTTVLVSGRGFTPNARINIYFDTKDEALAVANGAGSFSKISIVVPAKAIPGTHWISAVQSVGKLGAKAAFWVHTNWSQSGFTPNEDNFNPYENVLNPRTVGGLTLDWNYPDMSASAPSLVDHSIYFGSGNNVFSLNADTGQEQWEYSTGGNVGGEPAVANGVVYVGSNDFNIYALKASDGSLLWKYPTGSYVTAAPVIDNGVVYIGSEDNNFYALKASDGTLLWKYATGGLISFSAAVDSGLVYFYSFDGNIYALNAASGAVVWQHLTTAQYNGSTPSVANGVLYMASADANLYAVNSTNGNLLWTFNLGAPADGSTAAVAYDTVYVGSGDNGVFYAINTITGAKRWQYATRVPVYSASAVADGVVYFGSGDQSFYALNAANGKVDWRYTTGGYFPSGIVVNGKVYVAGASLYALGLPGGK